MPTISTSDMLSYPLRHSPNFTGSPKIEGNKIPSISANGDMIVDGSAISAKTLEYRLPSSWQSIYEYTLPEFQSKKLQHGYGEIFPEYGHPTIYINPSATVNGSGTLASPYNVLPAVLADNAVLLFQESSTYSFNVLPFVITAKNVIFGTYDIENGNRVIDNDRLVKFSFGPGPIVFRHTAANSQLTFSGVRFVCTSNNTEGKTIISSTDNTSSLQIEYCQFLSIDGRTNNVANTDFLINTQSKIELRYCDFVGCYSNLVTCNGNSARIYGNTVMYINAMNNFIAFSIAGSPKIVDISTNWMFNLANGGGFITSNTSNSIVKIKNNYIFGTDSDVIQYGTSAQYGIYCTFTGGFVNINDNLVCNTCNAIYAPASTIYKNIIAAECNNIVGITGNIVLNNTVIKLKGIGGTAIIATTEASNNIVDASDSSNMFDVGILLSTTSTANTSNIINNSTKSLTNNSGVSIVLNTNINASSQLDMFFKPFKTSPAYMTATIYAEYNVFMNKGAKQDFSKLGSMNELYAPTTGLQTLTNIVDNKADLASPSFIGNVTINNNRISQVIIRDFVARTGEGIAVNTLNTYALPAIDGNSILRYTLLFETTGSGSHTFSLHINGSEITNNVITGPGISKVEIISYNNVDRLSQIFEKTTTSINNSTMFGTSTVNHTNPAIMTIKAQNSISTDSSILRGIFVEAI